MSLLPIEDAPSSGVRGGGRGGGGNARITPIYIWHKASSPPPPRDPWAGVGWGPRDPPPYFWVEKLKKRGISLIRDSGRAQFQDLGPDLGANLAVISGALPWVLGLLKVPFWGPLWCPMLWP